MSASHVETCRICNALGPHQHHFACEMMFGQRTAFDYFQCSACGCLQIVSVPADIGEYYGEQYYSHARQLQRGAFAEAVIRARDRYALFGRGLFGRAVEKRFPNLAMRAIRPLAPPRDAAVLDVGCGSGHLLVTMAAIGFTDLTGMDPFVQHSIAYENGVRVLKQGIDQAQDRWDLVMFHHSFEHVADPAQALAAACKALTPKGCCVIRVPLADSHAWERYGVNWCQLDAPRHLYLHTQRSMQVLAQHTGLRIERVVHDSTDFQFWGSEQYERGIPMRSPTSYFENPKASIFSRAQIEDFRFQAARLNENGRGDQAVFYLRHA